MKPKSFNYADYVALKAENEQLTAERDAAVEDMKLIIESTTECTVCKHRVGASGCPKRYNDCEFDWRGTKGAKQ